MQRPIAALLAVSLFFLASCTRAPLRERAKALRPTSAPRLADDLGRVEFTAALERQAAFLATLKPETELRFGPRVVVMGEYARALDNLVRQSKEMPSDEAFFRRVESQFEFYEVYGGKRWGEILLTSYFEPEIPGSLTKTETFSTPLLKRPDDLIEVAASKFDDRLIDAGTLRGKMWRDPERKRDVLVPYFTRGEIDSGVLAPRKLELAWVDPVDAFFMQIQGSGTVLLSGDRRLRLGYSDQNGHMYHSIGKFLTDIIPLEKMTLLAIESHLKAIPREQAKLVMDRNPSFVFFDKLDGAPKTSIGNGVFPGRTIATDTRYFPKGALGFLKFKRPVFAGSDPEPSQWEEVSRFVFDQDTGGAIRGGGRADLFWGSGDEAKRYAGFIKDNARLYYLVPTVETLKQSPDDQLKPQ